MIVDLLQEWSFSAWGQKLKISQHTFTSDKYTPYSEEACQMYIGEI